VKLLGRFALFFAITGGSVAIGVAFMTSLSVLGRALFLQPIPGDVELTALGIGLAISLCIPWCQYQGANIMVDFFTQRCNSVINRRLDAAGMLLLGVMYFLLSWRTAVGAQSVKNAFEATMILDLPMWWAYASLAPGLCFAGVIALSQAYSLAFERFSESSVATAVKS
jgi:TRAP-type C4-dicarboxylate transport system permease small subunit